MLHCGRSRPAGESGWLLAAAGLLQHCWLLLPYPTVLIRSYLYDRPNPGLILRPLDTGHTARRPLAHLSSITDDSSRP
jgi:hypothetical protein